MTAPFTYRSTDQAITLRDFTLLLLFSGLLPFAWLLPVRLWYPVAYAVGVALSIARAPQTWATVRRIRSLHPEETVNVSAWRLELSLMAGYMQQHFQYLREYRRGGWNPTLRLFGRTHVDSALDAGRGAILWTTPFFYTDLAFKKAMHQAGLPLTHLSRFYHGSSHTRFGVRYINPIKLWVEDRYLQERLSMPSAGEMRYMRKLERVLAGNRLVSIAAGWEGIKTVRGTLLGGRLELATGPASLAIATGAPVLPVFVVSKALDVIDVIIEPPLSRRKNGKVNTAAEEMVQEFASRLEEYLLRYPRLTHVWRYLKTKEAAH